MAPKIPNHLKDRLPPGQTYVEKWPVLHEGSPLEFDSNTWRLRVHGLVENPVTIAWDEFQKWPKAERTSDFHCVTRWSIFESVWKGTLFSEFAKMVRPKSEAKFVRFADHQGYDTSVPLKVCMEPDVMLVTHWKGKPLDPMHGGPMRVVIPKLYGWKSCKWLVEVEFLAQDKLGYWEVRGYHNGADPFKEERFS